MSGEPATRLAAPLADRYHHERALVAATLLPASVMPSAMRATTDCAVPGYQV